jgi:hypothetical protein
MDAALLVFFFLTTAALLVGNPAPVDGQRSLMNVGRAWASPIVHHMRIVRFAREPFDVRLPSGRSAYSAPHAHRAVLGGGRVRSHRRLRTATPPGD